jgi:hypothetical protein
MRSKLCADLPPAESHATHTDLNMMSSAFQRFQIFASHVSNGTASHSMLVMLGLAHECCVEMYRTVLLRLRMTMLLDVAPPEKKRTPCNRSPAHRASPASHVKCQVNKGAGAAPC